MPQRPPRQLAFSLPHAESLSRDDFLEGPPNAAALALIERWPDWPNKAIALVGPEGCGKSHLAAIWALNAGARSMPAQALAATDVPGSLATGALVLADLQAEHFDENALFHLLNMARETNAYVLITARRPPLSLAVGLRDLRSRLRALPAVTMTAPDDALLRALIVKLCADRQMLIDDGIVTFLIGRIERSYAAAREAVMLLDAEALRLGRPVTRALAAELLKAR